MEGDGFGGDDVHEGTALGAGEDGAVYEGGDVFDGFFGFFEGVADDAFAKNQAAARAAEGFMGGGGHDVEAKI